MKNLEYIVKDQFKKLNCPEAIITIEKEYEDEYKIQYSSKGVYINFCLNLSEKTLFWNNLWLNAGIRGKGVGKKIINIGEYIAKEVGIEKGIVSWNINKSFWNHVGYFNDIKKF